MVTGANRGIGAEIATQLEQRGCLVIPTYRELDTLPPAQREHAIQLDVTDADSTARCANAVQRKHGRLDILVNNAGAVFDVGQELESVSIDAFRNTLEVNTIGVFAVTNALLPCLKAAKAARVVNISSGAGQLEEMIEWAPAYGISKTALNGLTVQQSMAFRKYGITVNCVRPGWVRTEMGGSNAPLSVAEGADTAVWLALDADPSQSGRLWFERKPTHW